MAARLVPPGAKAHMRLPSGATVRVAVVMVSSGDAVRCTRSSTKNPLPPCVVSTISPAFGAGTLPTLWIGCDTLSTSMLRYGCPIVFPSVQKATPEVDPPLPRPRGAPRRRGAAGDDVRDERDLRVRRGERHQRRQAGVRLDEHRVRCGRHQRRHAQARVGSHEGDVRRYSADVGEVARGDEVVRRAGRRGLRSSVKTFVSSVVRSAIRGTCVSLVFGAGGCRRPRARRG